MRTLTLPLAALLALTACNGSNAATEDTTAASQSTGDAPTTDTPTGAGVCGDGTRDEGEGCDGDDLDGKTCQDLDPMWSGGALQCSADCKYVTSGCESDPGAAQVALNEVTSKGAVDGPFADKGDAIELTNIGAEAIDLAGWKLSDDPTFPVDKTYIFPAGSSLAKGAFFVLVELNSDTMEGELPFGISSSKEETLTLANPSDVVVDQLIVQGAEAAVSYCRIPDGSGAWQTCDLTLGTANKPASVTCGNDKLEGDETCDGTQLGDHDCAQLGFTGGTLACAATRLLDASACTSGSMLVINELESSDDRIELYNAGAQAIDISGWILTDDPVDPAYAPDADLEKLVFPADSIVAPKEFLVIAKGDLPGQHPFGLGDTGDAVTLLDLALKPISHVSFGPSEAALSYCRLPDGPDGVWTVDCVPTLGLPNAGP